MKFFRYGFKAILQYVFFALVLMTGLYFLANYSQPFLTMLIFAGLLGLLIGIYQAWFSYLIFKNRPFWMRLGIQLIVIQFLIMLVLGISRSGLDTSALLQSDAGWIARLLHPEIIAFYLKAQLFSATLIFLVELEKILGRHFIVAYIFGRYRKPTQEQRIMLFIDIKDSTTIAEKLGDTRYYYFLNDCFERLTGATIMTDAEILKYVGDEVVVSWRDRSGTNADLALEFFRIFQNSIRKAESYFNKTYGIIPRFSAGVHRGSVTVAFIGEIKEQLDFSGDLMNTTARICDACKSYKASLLISHNFFQLLSKPRKEQFTTIGEVDLKGKRSKIQLHSFRVENR